MNILKNKFLRLVLSLIILAFAIVIFFIENTIDQAYITGIGVGYANAKFEGGISICINEVIQKEEWISPDEEVTDQDFDKFFRHEKDDIESVLLRIIPMPGCEGGTISAIYFYVDDEFQCELLSLDLAEAIDISSSSSCLVQQDGIVLKDFRVDEPIYLRIKKTTIEELKNCLTDYNEKNILRQKKDIFFNFIKFVIILMVCLFWVNFFFNRIISFFGFLFTKINDSTHHEWLYHIRGMAIIAVVVCHQQHFLHDAEWIQMISLYSVTTFIFCMGLTKGIVLKKNKLYKESYLKYLHHSLKGVLFPYLIASIVYLTVNDSFTNWNLLSALVNFNASGPLYFLWYVVVFSLMAPILFELSNYIYNNYDGIKRMFIFSFYIVSLFMIGYNFDIFGSTYLFVYAVGMIMPIVGFPKCGWKKWVLGITCLVVATAKLYNYYFNIFELEFSLDYLIPKVSINPPNFTVIFYSFSCILVFYCLFNSCFFKKIKPLSIILLELGKYSLDIFIWHSLIQHFFIVKQQYMGNIWMKRVVVYSSMFFIPILCRKIWIYTKKICSSVFAQQNN